MDANVNHLQVSTQTTFDPRGAATKRVDYSYFLGTHGPFTDSFAEGQDTTDAVNAAISARVAKLQALGALPTSTPGY
jgi:hypothetical protein